jgi:hypothetical protein
MEFNVLGVLLIGCYADRFEAVGRLSAPSRSILCALQSFALLYFLPASIVNCNAEDRRARRNARDYCACK